MSRLALPALLTGLLLVTGCPMMSASDVPLHTDDNTVAAKDFPGRHVLYTIKDGKEADPARYDVKSIGAGQFAALRINDEGDYDGAPLELRFVKLSDTAEFIELHVQPGDDLMGLVIPHGYNPDGNYWFARVERPDKDTIKLLGFDKKYADKAWSEDVGRLEQHPDVRTREVKVTDDNTGDLKPVHVIDLKADELRTFITKHSGEFNVHLWTLRREEKK